MFLRNSQIRMLMKKGLKFSKTLLLLFLVISFQTSFAQVTLKATSEKKNYSRPTRVAFDLINRLIYLHQNSQKYKTVLILYIF